MPRSYQSSELVDQLNCGRYDVARVLPSLLALQSDPTLFNAVASRALAAGHVELFEALYAHGAQLQNIDRKAETLFPLQGLAGEETDVPLIHALLSHYTHHDVRWRLPQRGPRVASMSQALECALRHSPIQSLDLNRVINGKEYPVGYLVSSLGWYEGLEEQEKSLNLLLSAGAQMEAEGSTLSLFHIALNQVVNPWNGEIAGDVLVLQDHFMETLLQHGMSSSDDLGVWPFLHQAASKGLVKTTAYLLDHGADPWALDDDAHCAWHYLRTTNEMLPTTLSMISLLHERGITLEDSDQTRHLMLCQPVQALMEHHRLQTTTPTSSSTGRSLRL